MTRPAIRSTKRNAGSWRVRLPPAAVAVVVALSLAGCITIGKPFNSDAVSLVKPGVTTLDEVHKMLGEPVRTGTEDGQVVWTYMKYHANIAGDFDGMDLTLHFDDQNRVVKIAFNSTDVGRQLKK